MADNLNGIPFSSDDEGKPFPDVAKQIVSDVTRLKPELIYVITFSYVLGYWKALCSTVAPDGRIYEVTYNKERKVAFVDTYVKVENVEVPVP